MEIGVKVPALIWPAFEIFLEEHQIVESELVDIAINSSAVPRERAQLFAKGLFYGFEMDFVSALFILVPQVEHLVRWHLKKAGVTTTTLSKDGIESENGLSALVDIPEVSKIFGADFQFELKALFCSAYGFNLRNEVAHGLLSYGQCESSRSIFCWAFCLRFVINTYRHTQSVSVDNAVS
jgi:hypothetical protein